MASLMTSAKYARLGWDWMKKPLRQCAAGYSSQHEELANPWPSRLMLKSVSACTETPRRCSRPNNWSKCLNIGRECKAGFTKIPRATTPESVAPLSSSDGEQRSGPVVTIAELSFEGSLLMTAADQAQISASIRQQAYSGDRAEVISQVLERAKVAWQEHGYSNVQVRGDSKILSSSPANEQVALTVHVDEGPQYRLERITFNNNREVTNVEALRSLFPIKNGSTFDHTAIREG